MRLFTSLLPGIFCFLLLPQKSQGQIGINLGYQINDTDGWQAVDNGSSVVADGYKVGIDYWFRLKNQRIEFTPELSYAFYESVPLANVYDFKIEFFSFQFNTNFYLLDLLNDCNCPTFSKQNDFFKKGFFIRVAPGITGIRFNNNDPDLADWPNEFGNLQPMIALGAGLDIGLSDLITISPIFTANYIPNAKWNGGGIAPINNPTSDFWQYTAGLRLGLRFSAY